MSPTVRRCLWRRWRSGRVEWSPITFVVVFVVSAPRLPIEDMFLSGAVEGERAAVEREKERERERDPPFSS